MKKIIFLLALPIYLILQVVACLGHLLVYMFDKTYSHEAAIKTFYPLPHHYKRLWVEDEDNSQ